MRVLSLAVALAALSAPVRAQLPPALAPLRFLLGAWEAVPGTDPAAGTGRATFSTELQDRVIVRTSYAAYAAAEGRPASRHDDLMVTHADGDTVRADYFDNEGHIIRYAVRARAPGEAVFVSDPAPAAPRYRLAYRQVADPVVDGRFEIAPPGAPDAFQTYLTWSARKIAPGAPAP